MIQVQAFRSMDAFDQLVHPWSALLAHSVVATPFQTTEFQRAWWAHFGNGELCLLAVRRDGELIGLVSMYVDEEAVLHWVGG